MGARLPTVREHLLERTRRRVAWDPDARLTTGEAALLLGVTAVSVQRYCNAQRLAVRRTLGGHRRILASDVLAHIPSA